MTSAQKEKYLKWLVFLAAIGMLVTAYLLYQHYKPAGGTFCNVNDYVNCDIVNKSIYSEIFGIPISAFGFGAYLIIFLSSLSYLKNWRWRLPISWLTIFAGVGLLLSLILTYIEFFILRAVCILCVTQQMLILIIFIILSILWRKSLKLSEFS